MTSKQEILGTEETWETGELGTDANFASLLKDSDEVEIDEALELHPISIRLQKSLIEDFKLIGQLNGVGYQPLMRQVLMRFADCEKKRILQRVAASAAERKKAQLGDESENEVESAAVV